MTQRAQATTELLAQREIFSQLLPVGQLEHCKGYTHRQLHERLEDFLIFGTRPETIDIAFRDDKISYLTEFVRSHLLADIIARETIRAPDVLFNLLQLLAFQIGQELSVGEMANRLGVDGKTVSRYLELLEKSGIILRLHGFGRKLPGEITRKSRYYFIDNGIRNALLSQFNSLRLRSDTDQLWENFVVVERFKKQTQAQASADSYFWRTYSGQQLELVEEIDGQLHGYGFKLSDRKTPRTPRAWFRAYPEAHYHVVNLNNYLEFIA